jgi:Leucine-rich repeat (LRR) protein
MLGSASFAFETPNVIDPGDLPPSRPQRQESVSRRDSNTDSTGEISSSSSSSEEYNTKSAARESATRLLRDIDDIDHLTQDYDPYDEEEGASGTTSHEQLPSVEEARMYATSLLSSSNKTPGRRGGARDQETVPLALHRTIKLDSPSSKHLVRKRIIRCLVPVLVVLGLLAATISIGLALVNRMADNENGNNNGSGSGSYTDSERYHQTVQFLSQQQISARIDLNSAGTPQNLAANWVADIDSLQYGVPSTTDNPDESFRFVQRYTLATFFFAFRGTGWDDTHNFMTEQDECAWFDRTALDFAQLETAVGVSCDSDLHVRGIFLPNNNLIGRLPPELSHLSRLDMLALPFNALTGALPDELSVLSKMIYLDFRHNDIDDSIPSWVGDYEFLEVLGLSNNQLVGTVPPSLGTLRRLKTLALDDNLLSGSLNFASYLSNVEYFYADRNLFEQQVDATFLENLDRLRQLDLSSNLITSEEFPAALLAHPKLEVLDLANNKLGGNLPPIVSNNILKFLSFRNNQLTGGIPISFPALKKLSHLDLQGNRLGGFLPARFATMTSLSFLFLGSNDFFPDILPGLLSELTELRELSMSNAQLSGVVPNWLPLLTNLKVLDLSQNRYVATHDDEIKNTSTSVATSAHLFPHSQNLSAQPDR